MIFIIVNMKKKIIQSHYYSKFITADIYLLVVDLPSFVVVCLFVVVSHPFLVILHHYVIV